MNLYEIPEFNISKLKNIKVKRPSLSKNRIFWGIILIILLSSIFGFLAGIVSGTYFYSKIRNYLSDLNIELPGITKIIEKEYVPQTTQEEVIISAVNKVSPSVVSILATKDVPVLKEYYYDPFEGLFEEFFGPQFKIPQYKQEGIEKQEIGGGSGFIISKEGMVLTNKHVVLDEEADYTVFTNDGKNYPATVLARDPYQDLAVLKINGEEEQPLPESFPVISLGDSDKIQIGQTVIAIGNALGEYRNTVSVGVVSGLSRTITAVGGGFVETLEDVIQTDAAINQGNSGGPLLNLKGEVIGINTAMVQQAQSIGFAIKINKAKRDIEQVKKSGQITYPFLGIRYVLITETIKEENNLPADYGVWIVKGESGEPAVHPNSAAEKAGLKEGDIVLEFNGEKITLENTLAEIIIKYNPDDLVTLKILRDNEEKNIQVNLGERSE